MCKAKIWRKSKFLTCTNVNKNDTDFCRYHQNYSELWLNENEYTICKRCNKGFEKNNQVRCDECNQKSNKPKNPNCIFTKKDGKQCTNQQKIGQYCGTHKKYADLGVTAENRCKDCGKVNDTENRLCSTCQNKRNVTAIEKRKIKKLVRINKQMDSIKLEDCKISPYFLSGFFDGDGSICITEGLSLQIQFTQCVVSILNKIKDIFGGSLYKSEARNENCRDTYSLRFCGRDCEEILKYLDIGSIMKWEQIQIAKQFINMNKLNGLESKKVELKEKMRKLNKSYKKTHNKPYDKINWEYIAGIFDAEGCIYMRQHQKHQSSEFKHKFGYIKITQTNDYKLLEKIREFVGHGRTDDKTSWKTERIDFAKWDLNKISPLLIVKKKQTDWCLEFFDCKDKDRQKELFELIKADKHN